MKNDLERSMDADGPDLESWSALDRLSMAALALVDDGIEPTFEALNACVVDQCSRSVDYPAYADWAGAPRRSTGDRNRRRWFRSGRPRWPENSAKYVFPSSRGPGPRDRRMQKV